MKIKLLFVLFLLSAASVGQNLKTVTRYDWNLSTWIEKYKETYDQYDHNNRAIHYLQETWNTNTNSWTNRIQSFATYNADNQRVFGTTHYWRTTTNSWDDMNRWYFTYNADGNMLTQTIQDTNNGAGWRDWQVYNFTYDENGYLILQVVETWGQTQIITAIQYIYNNNSDGTVNNIIEQQKNLTTNQWELYDRETYSYTATGQIDKILMENYQTSWYPSRQREFVYDSNDYLIVEKNEFWNSDHFELSFQRIHTNDDNGKILEILQSYIYQPDSNYKLVYEYETLSTASFENTDSFTISPNPVQNFLDLNFSNSIQGQIKISDATGKTLIQQSIDNHNSRIDTSTLPSGLYFMEFRNNDAIAVKKFIKN